MDPGDGAQDLLPGQGGDGKASRHCSLFLQLYQEAARRMPAGWFELHSLGDDGFEHGRDHVLLERVGGPPVGSFHVWHHAEQVRVRGLPELDQDVGGTSWAREFRDVAEAVTAINGAIEATLRAWALPIMPGVPPHRSFGS